MSIKAYLINLMDELQISPVYIGYVYLQSAVLILFDNFELKKSLTKNVYSKLSRHYDVAVSRIEKNLNHCIRRSYKAGGLRAINPDKCPSKKVVCLYLVEKLNEKFKNNN